MTPRFAVRSTSHFERNVKKLEGVSPGDGQYRLRLGRFRFRYDIVKQVVYLKACVLRSESSYRN